MTTSDQGDIVISWLSRLVVAFALVAVVGFDAVTIALATVSVQDQANTAAQAARDSFLSTHNPQLAFKAARASALVSDPANVVRPAGFSIAADGHVTVHLQRPIHTVFAHFLPVRGFKTAVADGAADPSTG